MLIKSDENNLKLRIVETLQYLFSIPAQLYILGMSYGKFPEQAEHVLFISLIGIVFTNIQYSVMTRNQMQLLEDNGIKYLLSRSKVFSPISLLLSLIMLGTLVTGQMVGWYWYLIYLVIGITISKVHMKGIVKSSDEKGKDTLGELIKRAKNENRI